MTHSAKIITGFAVLHVEYEVECEGSEASYSPMHGAVGGDPLIVSVTDAWSEEYGPAVLTDDEREMIEADICCQHVPDYDDDLEYE